MRSRYLVLWLLTVGNLITSRPAVADDRPRRVLILASFGRDVAPFGDYITGFRSELRDRWPGPLDLFEVSLESARFPRPEDDESLVSFLAAHLVRDRVDMVALVGEPAVRFANRHGKRLFSGVPVLIVGVDRRRLRPEYLGPMTVSVGDRFDLTWCIEDILQVLPATRQIVVVFGVSQMDRFWSDECRRAFARFENRVQFRWLDGLSLEAMKREVASLHSDSAVLYGMLIRDADGMSFEQMHAFIRLKAVSSAPVFGCFESQMGLGIVGGRLLPDLSRGVMAARVGARILHGEAPSSIQSPPVEPRPPAYDWRELERWHIAKDRLPLGSSVMFRPPSFWQLYRWYVLGFLAIVALQTILITVLLLQRRRRDRTERQLTQSERRLHTITDSLSVLIAHVDREQRYVFNNRAYESQFGVDPESIRGRTIREVVGNELYEVARPYIERVLSGETVTFDADQMLPRGQRRALRAIYLPDKDDRGIVRGFFTMVVDVTARKHAEQEARQLRDELAHAGRIATMGEMAAALAHELNQPLAAILSNAQAATRFLSGPNPDLAEVCDILHDIADDDARAGEVIGRIRSLVKKDSTELRTVNLNTILEEVIVLLHSDAVIRGVVISRELDLDLPKILGDRIQLQQVVLNLLLNAFDAMRDGLSRDRKVIVRSRHVDSEVLVTVRDSGPGILPEDMDKLFEPFRSTKPGGLGMGLSISRSIVASHGGRMWAENNRRRGATFSFTFPVHVDAALSVCQT
jgi:PAS domain S-box-containing protein